MTYRLDASDFGACPPYNEWLDEQFAAGAGKLDILGYQPRPSFVLFTMSPDTYQAAFDDFRRQREEEVKELVINEFPSPIAHYFYRFENGYENELQRLHFLRDTWEALIDTLHAIAVSECRFLRVALGTPLTFKDCLTDSVAQRLLNIERILLQAQADGIDLQIVDLVPITTLQTMRELNQSRNAFSHTAAQSELQARTWTGECYEDVIDTLTQLQDLAKVQVLRHMGQADARTLRCEVFRGHAFTRTIANISLTEDQARTSLRYLRQGQILILSDEAVFGLRPWVHFREDASGHTTKLCVFRRTRGDVPNRRLEYEVVGESTLWDEDRASFSAELNELRGLFGLEPE